MKIYLSGRMKGVENFEALFRAAKNKVDKEYPECIIINPCDLCPAAENPGYKEYLINDIEYLLYCDAIYMLVGWEQSQGAFCEWVIAKSLGMKIFYEAQS